MDGNAMLDQLEVALRRRRPIREKATDALRIVDGPGDGFEDLEIDDFAGHWLVQTRGSRVPDWLKETGARSIFSKRLGDKAAPRWYAGQKVTGPFEVLENGLRFLIDFEAGYSQGLFLDQRENRATLRTFAPGKTVLNCFSYTCAFGVAAAAGGGITTNIDLSKRILEWGRRNYELNGLLSGGHDFIYGDVFEWLRRLARKRRKFDIVILDPPTFSRNSKGKVFRVEDDLGWLVELAAGVLNPGGKIFCSTNQRSLSPAGFRRIIYRGLSDPARWKFQPASMPEDFRGEQYLKCGWLVCDG
jgi:23S rRNA (cytosine1962-C5)-methyltransferase